jgi:hypothetical protein
MYELVAERQRSVVVHFARPSVVGHAGGGRIVYIWMPQLASMRRLPEFKAYMREVGMVAYWQEFGWPPFCHMVEPTDFECD